jgi:hypothetical protein
VVLEDWRIKVSVLWLFYAVALTAYMTLAGLQPGVLKDFLEKGTLEGVQVTPELMLLFAIMILAPLTMAVVALTLRDSVSRWANIIVGIVFVIIQVVALGGTIAESSSAWMILMEIAKLIAPILIVWYAYKPKQKA